MPKSAFLILAATAAATSGMASPQTVIPLTQPMAGIDAMQVEVAGRSGLYMFDSGWGVSALTPGTAAAIGCEPWGKITGFRATGERVDLQRCNATELMFGTLKRRLKETSVVDLTKYMGAAGEQFAGGIGLDAFDGQVVTLSVSQRSLTIEDERSARRVETAATEVPIRLVRDSQGAALTADIGIPTRLGTVWLEIDTGNYGPSRIDRRAATLLGLDPETKGRQPLDVKVAGTLRLGGAGVVGDLIMDGNIGRDALKNWDVTLDLAHQRGWLRPTGPASQAS